MDNLDTWCCFLRQVIIPVEFIPNILPHSFSTRIIEIQGISGFEIPMPESGDGVPFPTRFVDDPVQIALVLASRPFLEHVSQVDHEFIFDRRNEDPFLFGLMPHLKAILAGILQQYGDATVIRVLRATELSWIFKGVLRIADELDKPERVDQCYTAFSKLLQNVDSHCRLRGQLLENSSLMTQTGHEDLPNLISHSHHVIEVFRYGLT